MVPKVTGPTAMESLMARGCLILNPCGTGQVVGRVVNEEEDG